MEPQQQTNPTVVVVDSIQYGPKSQNVICPYCKLNVNTEVKHKANSDTHLLAALLCCFVCWPLVCCPYCTGTCMNADHYCPNCKQFLGTYKK